MQLRWYCRVAEQATLVHAALWEVNRSCALYFRSSHNIRASGQKKQSAVCRG